MLFLWNLSSDCLPPIFVRLKFNFTCLEVIFDLYSHREATRPRKRLKQMFEEHDKLKKFLTSFVLCVAHLFDKLWFGDGDSGFFVSPSRNLHRSPKNRLLIASPSSHNKLLFDSATKFSYKFFLWFFSPSFSVCECIIKFVDRAVFSESRKMTFWLNRGGKMSEEAKKWGSCKDQNWQHSRNIDRKFIRESFDA